MQQPVHFLDLERAYSDFATNFIAASAEKKQPFFLYYPSHVSIGGKLKPHLYTTKLSLAKENYKLTMLLVGLLK